MRPSTGAIVIAMAVAVAVPVGACSRGDPPAEPAAVRPLAEAGEPDAGRTVSTATAEAVDRTGVDRPPADPAPSEDRVTDEGPPGATQRIDALLDRFDVAITGLYRQPLAAGDDEHPASIEWLRVVVAGSQLDRQVRGRVLATGTVDGMRVEPPAPGTTSFVNSASEVREVGDGSVTWTNCGFSPGVGIAIADGRVLDDSRAVTRGRGRAVLGAEGTLVVAELWDDSTEVLPADAENPCEAG